MERQKKRPGVWYYGLAGLVLVLGCVVAAVVAYCALPDLPGALKTSLSLDNLTQVVVPGTAEIEFDEPGAYAVYYERESVVDGVRYTGSRQPPALECGLSGRRTGARVAAVPDFVETNTYSTRLNERVGLQLMSITIDEPDAYTFACQYADGASRPNVVVAVGPSFMWEFFNIGARVGLSLLAGLGVLLASMVLAVVIAIVVAVRRRPRPA